MLRLQSVSRSYWRGASEVAVLKDVSLSVPAGQLVAVHGRPNAGKTTLLKIAAGFEPPDRGRVTFDGEDLAGSSRSRLARLHREEIAWVERAGPHSRDLAARMYVALPLYKKLGPREAERRAAAMMTRLGVGDCSRQRWDSLSDTARTFVAIAQALVREPRLLIVDDPTLGLGIVDRERVVGLLRSAAEDGGLGVLLAVPEMPALLHAHEVRSISRGRLIAPSSDAHGDRGGTVVDLALHQRGA